MLTILTDRARASSSTRATSSTGRCTGRAAASTARATGWRWRPSTSRTRRTSRTSRRRCSGPGTRTRPRRLRVRGQEVSVKNGPRLPGQASAAVPSPAALVVSGGRPLGARIRSRSPPSTASGASCVPASAVASCDPTSMSTPRPTHCSAASSSAIWNAAGRGPAGPRGSSLRCGRHSQRQHPPG